VWFEQQQEVKNSERLRRGIESHRFFNDVLRKIQSVLLPYIEPTLNPSTSWHAQGQFPAGIRNTTNMFAQSDLEETDADGGVRATLNTKESKLSEEVTTYM
jgi:hypothetical protein